MTITTEEIKKLREQTGVSVMKCKAALEEAEGDMEKALTILQQKSKDAALKKSDRSLGSGVVVSYVHSNNTIGVLLELACETDFVAKNEEFKDLAYQIAMHAAAMNPTYIHEQEISDQEREKIKELLTKEVADKPKEVQGKALTGKLESHFKERTLMDQKFIKDSNMTMAELIEAAVQKFGERTEVVRLTRFEVGKE